MKNRHYGTETILLSISREEFQALIIDCVTACLKANQPIKEQDTLRPTEADMKIAAKTTIPMKQLIDLMLMRQVYASEKNINGVIDANTKIKEMLGL